MVIKIREYSASRFNWVKSCKKPLVAIFFKSGGVGTHGDSEP